MSKQGYRSPTTDEYATIKRVWEDTGILTVKDKVTAGWLKPQERCGGVKWDRPWQDRPEYGVEYSPAAAERTQATAGVGFADKTYHVRAVAVEHVGTPELPKGIAIGGVEAWVESSVLTTGDAKCVRWFADIAPDEETRLFRWARGIRSQTDAEMEARVAEQRTREAHGAASQVDPVGTLERSFEKVLERIAGKSEPVSVTPEGLAAAGWTKKPDGSWAPPVPVGAGK